MSIAATRMHRSLTDFVSNTTDMFAILLISPRVLTVDENPPNGHKQSLEVTVERNTMRQGWSDSRYLVRAISNAIDESSWPVHYHRVHREVVHQQKFENHVRCLHGLVRVALHARYCLSMYHPRSGGSYYTRAWIYARLCMISTRLSWQCNDNVGNQTSYMKYLWSWAIWPNWGNDNIGNQVSWKLYLGSWAFWPDWGNDNIGNQVSCMPYLGSWAIWWNWGKDLVTHLF